MNERDKVIWSEAAKATEGAGDSWDAQVAFMQKFADLIRADERDRMCERFNLSKELAHEKAKGNETN